MQINFTKTIAAACALVAAISPEPARAWEGSVWFYENAFFTGKYYHVTIRVSDRCINIGCFNDRASSARWENLPLSGDFVGDARIAFYTDTDCGGVSRQWRTFGSNFPINFQVDGINDAISSFKVIRYPFSNSAPPFDVCRTAATGEPPLLSNGTMSEASAVVMEAANETSANQGS